MKESSIRLPIVMREHGESYSQVLKSAQDASVVDIHLPSTSVPHGKYMRI